MKMHEVTSSQIHSIGHDAAKKILAITFKKKDGSAGSTYHYENFTEKQFADFKAAKSHGTHFGAHIKPFGDKHPYKKV